MAYSRRPYSVRPYSAQRQQVFFLARDAGAPAGWASGIIRDAAGGVETSAAMARDAAAPIRTAAASSSASLGPYRTPYGVRPYSAPRFGVASGGSSGTLIVRDAGAPGEVLAALRHDAQSPAERVVLLIREAPGPGESLAGLRADAGAPAAWGASVARDGASPAFLGASVARDAGAPLLSAAGLVRDAGAPLLLQTGLARDAGTPLAISTGLIRDAGAPARIAATLARDAGARLEYAAALALDGSAALERVVEVFGLAADAGAGLEILAGVATDASVPAELFGSTSQARGLAEVEQTLVSLISGLVFPTQGYLSGNMTPAITVSGMGVKIYRGWPESANLAADMQAGNCHVSIFSEPGMTRNTSRFWPEAQPLPATSPTITLSVSGQTVTVGGTITPGNVAGIQYGAAARAWAFAVAAQPGDVADTIAAALAAQIPGASSAGAVVTLPYWALNIQAVTMAPQQHWLEVRRQVQGIRVSCWCPTPAARDLLAEQIDIGLAGLRDSFGRLTRFFTVPSGGRVWLQNALRATYVNDMPSRDRVWRRDLCYMIEYPTSLIEAVPRALFIGGTVTSYGAADYAWGATQPPTEFQASDAGLVSDGTGLLGESPDAGTAPGGGDDGTITDDQGNPAGTA